MNNFKLFFIVFLFGSNHLLSQVMENKLVNEKSLYLKQHATNPVYWFPWNDEALEIAQKVAKVDVKEMSRVLNHDVVGMTITYT